MMPKKKGPPEMGALDELMGAQAAAPPPATAAGDAPEDDSAAPAAPPPPPAAPPKGDPAELISSIQTQLAELQSLLG